MKYFEKPKIRPHVIIGIPWEGFLSFPLFKKKNQSLGQKLYKSRVYHLEKRLFLEAGSYWSLRVSETKEKKGVLNFWVISFFTLFVMQCCFFPENVLISYNLSTGKDITNFEQTVLAPDIGSYIRGLFHTSWIKVHIIK